jgi:hypothetical protein
VLRFPQGHFALGLWNAFSALLFGWAQLPTVSLLVDWWPGAFE